MRISKLKSALIPTQLMKATEVLKWVNDWPQPSSSGGGGIAAMIFAISGGLRLARFNATMDDPNKPAFAGNYFTGVPAPLGALCVLLPMYLVFIGAPQLPAPITAVFTLSIAFLMVSRLPVFSGKMLGGKIAPEMVLPVVVLVVLFIAVLISYPWHLLTGGSIIYLLSLPVGWSSYRAHERRAREAAATSEPGHAAQAAPDFNVAAGPVEDERPPRLN